MLTLLPSHLYWEAVEPEYTEGDTAQFLITIFLPGGADGEATLAYAVVGNDGTTGTIPIGVGAVSATVDVPIP